MFSLLWYLVRRSELVSLSPKIPRQGGLTLTAQTGVRQTDMTARSVAKFAGFQIRRLPCKAMLSIGDA
jgi:hypothetical protein